MPKAKSDSTTIKPRRSTAPTARPAADPIFAAIEKHRKLVKTWNALSNVFDLAETKAEKKYGRRPWSLIAWRDYSAIGGSEIEDRRAEFLRLASIDPKKIEKEYLAAKARERAGQRALSGHGISALISQHNASNLTVRCQQSGGPPYGWRRSRANRYRRPPCRLWCR
jgi:hypothetical protein